MHGDLKDSTGLQERRQAASWTGALPDAGWEAQASPTKTHIQIFIVEIREEGGATLAATV
jgi:hypothetical protein